MSQIEVIAKGDLISFTDPGGSPYYFVVQEIDHANGTCSGNWAHTPEEARSVAKAKSQWLWGSVTNRQIFEGLVTVVERAGAVSPNPASRGACSCPWSMLVRGCECGAIKKFQPTY
jgi:hypothetical protein